MSETCTVTFVLRAPASAEDIGQRLLAGTYEVSAASQPDLAADPGDVRAVIHFINTHGLQLLSEDADSRTVRASGTIPQLDAAFDISLGESSNSEGSPEPMYHQDEFNMPAALAGIVIAVLGLDQRAIARHHEAG